MSRLQIFGATRSRTLRALWLAEELGLDYHQRQKDETGLDYLTVNPAGKVPSIDDDGLVLSESMAINMYLVKKHGGDLAPRDLAEEAMILQWTFWAVTEVESTALSVLFNRVLRPEEERDANLADQGVGTLQKPLGILNDALADRQWLVADRFTIADLNVAAVLSWVKLAQVDLGAFPNLTAWLGRCMARPALVKILKS
ncbi:MAG: glutathione S-transferase family protein [Proteobacteria bacterium]|nr:glutathione S-transferase family protein [Pseudomonadota bacterium]